MPVNDSKVTAEQSPSDGPVIPVERLCLDFEQRREVFGERLDKFLRANREALQLNGADHLAAAYVERVWPNGLPGTAIISNVAANGHPRWLIRPPAEGPAASTFAAGRWAPAFLAFRKQARLVIDDFRLVPHVPRRSFERFAAGPVHVNSVQEWMTKPDLETLAALPKFRTLTDTRLAPWLEYLSRCEKLAHLGRLALRYESVEYLGAKRLHLRIKTTGNERRIAGRLRGGPLLAAALSASESPERWQPRPDSRTFIKLGKLIDITPVPASRDASDGLRQFDLTIAVEEPRLALPPEGFLLTSVAGELRPLKNERRAIERLARGPSFNAYLAAWMFDIQQAALPDEVPDVCADEPWLAGLNAEQREAVNKAFAAPEIFLLQGPPGTGKTTVIAAICFLLARRGHRVLVSSQTNLAVDNALSRLPLRADVRPLRVGKPQYIGEEGQELLEIPAVQRWLLAIAETVERRFQERTELERRIREAEGALITLGHVLADTDREQTELRSREETLQSLRAELETTAGVVRQRTEELAEMERRQKVLDEFRRWLVEPSLAPPELQLLAETPVALALVEAADSARGTAHGLPWQPTWPTSTDALTGSAEVLQHAVLVSQACETLLEAILRGAALCRSQSGAIGEGEKREFVQLQAERARLLDSENPEDLARVAQINRQIHQLRDQQWAPLTRQVRSILQVVFQASLPHELDELSSSLQAEPRWLTLLESLAEFAQTLPARIRAAFDDHVSRLGTITSGVAQSLADRRMVCMGDLNAAREHQVELEGRVEDASEGIRQSQTRLADLHDRWRARWAEVPMVQSDPPQDIPPIRTEHLESRRLLFHRWLADQQPAMERSRRWQSIQKDWLTRIGDPSAAERSSLRALYIRHANVFGLTCNEAGQRDLYENPQFEPFDVVIIDEVSKATPIELLMPMLLGRKVIPVGDHQQLSPTYRDDEQIFAEIADDGLLGAEESRRFEALVTASYFGELFEKAPEALRHFLTVGYRPHPHIMGVFNPFYDGRLQSAGGDKALGERRGHYLYIKDRRGGTLLEPSNHVLWIDSTRDARGRDRMEVQVGTSKSNPLEADLIAELLRRLDEAARQRGYGLRQQLEARPSHVGLSMREWLAGELPTIPPETLAEAFDQRMVRRHGRGVRPEEVVRPGDRLDIALRKPVGVITFYGAQLKLLRQRIAAFTAADSDALSALDVRCNTVDRFQGMERAIVIVSLVRARPQLRGGEYVKRYQRINVAFSRAQQLLVIVGSERTFRDAIIELPSVNGGPPRRVAVYRNIFELVQRLGGRRYAHQIIA
jgi:energy-coupling factor transporter ATP-binding protein EcfA2